MSNRVDPYEMAHKNGEKKVLPVRLLSLISYSHMAKDTFFHMSLLIY